MVDPIPMVGPLPMVDLIPMVDPIPMADPIILMSYTHIDPFIQFPLDIVQKPLPPVYRAINSCLFLKFA